MSSSVVIRIRTPFGMTRSSFPPETKINEIIENVSKDLLKKNQRVDGARMFVAPYQKDKSPLENKSIRDYSFRDGQMLELKGGFESTIEVIPESEKSIFEQAAIPYEIPQCALHGPGQSCVRCMIAKYIRVDRKDKADCAGIQVDKKAVAVFKYNLEANLAYSVQRVGILYGKKNEEGWLQVDFIYEPPQENEVDEILLLKNENEQKLVDTIAEALGLTKLGCIIGQTADDCDDEEFILTAQQILMAAEIKGESKDFVILFAGIRDEIPFVEGYELTDQFYDLYNRRYFKEPKDDFFLQVKEPLWIEAKEEYEAEVEFFICPVALKDYRNEFNCEFPVENRLIKQTSDFLKKLIGNKRGKDLANSLYDFHVLLFLAPFFDRDGLINLCNQAINGELSDGNVLVICGIAGIH